MRQLDHKKDWNRHIHTSRSENRSSNGRYAELHWIWSQKGWYIHTSCASLYVGIWPKALSTGHNRWQFILICQTQWHSRVPLSPSSDETYGTRRHRYGNDGSHIYWSSNWPWEKTHNWTTLRTWFCGFCFKVYDRRHATVCVKHTGMNSLWGCVILFNMMIYICFIYIYKHLY